MCVPASKLKHFTLKIKFKTYNWRIYYWSYCYTKYR